VRRIDFRKRLGCSTPRTEEAGWSSRGIEDAKGFAQSIGTAAFMLVHDGAVVATYGDVSRRYMAHSVRKSLLSALYGIYTARRSINLQRTLGELGIDDRLRLTDSEKQATVLDLLKARSGVYHPAAYRSEAGESRLPHAAATHRAHSGLTTTGISIRSRRSSAKRPATICSARSRSRLRAKWGCRTSVCMMATTT
jgi:hypothetical protein